MTTFAGALNRAPIARPVPAARPLHRLIDAARQAIHRRRTRRALNQLSDQILQDIGLRRGEIDSVAQALAEGHPDPTRTRRGRNIFVL